MLATEATGDLTLSATTNFTQWEPHARAFQLLQYKSFLFNLHKLKPLVVTKNSDPGAVSEWDLMNNFATNAANLLEKRLSQKNKNI
jgi:hypothetical protein